MFRFETTGVATFLLVMRTGFLVFFTTTEPGFDVAFYWIFVVFGRGGSARMPFPCLSEIADERKCSLSACFEGRFILTPPPRCCGIVGAEFHCKGRDRSLRFLLSKGFFSPPPSGKWLPLFFWIWIEKGNGMNSLAFGGGALSLSFPLNSQIAGGELSLLS